MNFYYSHIIWYEIIYLECLIIWIKKANNFNDWFPKYSIKTLWYVMVCLHTRVAVSLTSCKKEGINSFCKMSLSNKNTVFHQLDSFWRKNSYLIIYLKNDDSLKSAIYNIYFSCQFSVVHVLLCTIRYIIEVIIYSFMRLVDKVLL